MITRRMLLDRLDGKPDDTEVHVRFGNVEVEPMRVEYLPRIADLPPKLLVVLTPEQAVASPDNTGTGHPLMDGGYILGVKSLANSLTDLYHSVVSGMRSSARRELLERQGLDVNTLQTVAAMCRAHLQSAQRRLFPDPDESTHANGRSQSAK